MSELSERLREAHPNSQQYALGSNILHEAAQEIESLQAQLSEARAQNKSVVVPEGWHVSRTEGGNIIVQKSHVAGFVASEQSGGIAESTLYYLADDLLTASSTPEHSGDNLEMVEILKWIASGETAKGCYDGSDEVGAIKERVTSFLARHHQQEEAER